MNNADQAQSSNAEGLQLDGGTWIVVGFEVMVLTEKRIPTSFPLRVGDVIVETKPVIRYQLGMWIDS